MALAIFARFGSEESKLSSTDSRGLMAEETVFWTEDRDFWHCNSAGKDLHRDQIALGRNGGSKIAAKSSGGLKSSVTLAICSSSNSVSATTLYQSIKSVEGAHAQWKSVFVGKNFSYKFYSPCIFINPSLH